MTLVKDIIAKLAEWAPLDTAETWDNVGLLCGDRESEVRTVFFCVDYTDSVAAEARKEGAQLVVAYHPPIFSALKRIPFNSAVGRALRDGVALYSPHTALDVAVGGTNDVLADACGLVERAPLRPTELKLFKLVTFVPEEATERVASALFDAGAGRIGDYEQCSFRTPGTGTFFPLAGAHPVVGQVGTLERAPEVRLETIVPVARMEHVLKALRNSHPYEEPAFDLLQMLPIPGRLGQGRVGDLASAVTLETLLEHVKKHMGVTHALVAGSGSDKVRRVAVAAGAGGDLLNDALAAKADVFVTGEVRHHDALRAMARGMRVVALLHSNSERRAVSALSERVATLGVRSVMSTVDQDPFTIR